MLIQILGAAAGGGFPQWNCGCSNCSRLRAGQFAGSPRTQIQAAVSLDGEAWFLLGASPDLRRQIGAFPPLHAKPGSRNTPIEGIVLTAAEVDQCLGLLLLREFEPLRVYSTPSVRKILIEDNSLFGVLRRSPGQVNWMDIQPARPFQLTGRAPDSPRIECEPIPLPGSFPGFVTRDLPAHEAVLGLKLTAPSGRSAFYLPGAALTSELAARLDDCDVLLLDGTFWDDGELIRAGVSGRTARSMGHTPISGPGGSLELLATLRKPRKIFLHINNTNPILDEAGAERRQVGEAGWEVAYDGMEVRL